MAEQGDDDSFLEDFLARAKQRQEKLAQITKRIEAHAADTTITTPETVISTMKSRDDVTYPPLSPLEEEQSGCLDDDDSMSYDVENKGENVSMGDGEMNYSSDLSISCDQEDTYRAKLVYANSSPDHHHHHQQQPQPQPLPLSTQISPRKRAHSTLQASNTDHQQQQQLYPFQIQEKVTSVSSTISSSSSSQDQTLQSQEQKATSSQSLPELSIIEQSIKDLELKVSTAKQNRDELKKAIHVAKYGSQGHIEVAYRLQIAQIKHLNYTNFMAMFEQGLPKKSESLGSVKISTIRLKISPKLRSDLAEDSVSHYFFCIAFCGTEVKATKIMDTNDIKRQDLKAYIHFNDKLTFGDLPPDFNIKLEVYQLVISQQMPKLLLRLTPSKKPKIDDDLRPFKRVGSLYLKLADKEVNKKNLYQSGKLEESKYIERECQFEIEVTPPPMPAKSGKLSVFFLDNSGRPNWTRLWFDLFEARIRYWKSEQDALDDRRPNQVLEFKDICCKIQKLTPDDSLYRQHSFIVYTYQQVIAGDSDTMFQRILKNNSKFKIVRHVFCAQNKEERDSWCSILDRCIICFHDWQGKNKIYTNDEIMEIFDQEPTNN